EPGSVSEDADPSRLALGRSAKDALAGNLRLELLMAAVAILNQAVAHGAPGFLVGRLGLGEFDRVGADLGQLVRQLYPLRILDPLAVELPRARNLDHGAAEDDFVSRVAHQVPVVLVARHVTVAE